MLIRQRNHAAECEPTHPVDIYTASRTEPKLATSAGLDICIIGAVYAVGTHRTAPITRLAGARRRRHIPPALYDALVPIARR